ncbi:MAG: hypothetical protein CME36_15475 [unclassified Hahellaceae]|nr:hypothetical protein [Hahellaceae bacterium]|tara:strand:+ start:12283 stop:15204 length:2922 start_codon:yes stop_codon:yes gene_type:complete
MTTSLFPRNKLCRAILLGASLALASGLPTSATAAPCDAPQWQEGNTFKLGQEVIYQQNIYRALVTHTAWTGAGWTPLTNSLWTLVGPAYCGGGGIDSGDGGVNKPGDGGDDPSTPVKSGTTRFIPYIYSWGIGNSAYWVNDLRQLPSGVNDILLAFALAYGDEIRLQADDPDLLKTQISAAHQKNIKVGVSTGGASAGYLHEMAGTPAVVASKFVAFVKDYGFDFIDVDFEGSYIADAAARDRMVAIMAAVRRQLPQHPITLTVPSHGGETGLSSGVIAMAKAMYDANALSAVTAMSFDYYGLNRDVYQAAKVSVGLIAEHLTGECNTATGMVCADHFDEFDKARGLYGIISMIGKADDGHATTVDEQARQTKFAKDNGLYSIGFWALNRDQSCDIDLAQCSGVSAANGAYTTATVKALGQFGGGNPGSGSGGSDGGTGGGSGDGSSGGGAGGGDSCVEGAVAAWTSGAVYTKGMQSTHGGRLWEAQWWTQNDTPGTGGDWGVWRDRGAAEDCPDGGDGGTDGGDGGTGGGTDGGTDGDTDGGSDGGGNGGGTDGGTDNPDGGTGGGGNVVASYFVEWGIYGRNYHVADVPAEKLSHLLYGFIAICGPNESLQLANPAGYSALMSECADQADYTVTIHDRFAALEKSYPGDKWDDPIRGNFGQLAKMKAANPHIKVLPSIGGWTLSDPFHPMANDPAKRRTFITSTIEFLKTYKVFDGLDLDWEYPGGGGANPKLGADSDAEAFATLMRELRQALDGLEAETGREYLLTAAVGAAAAKIDKVDYQNAAAHMDYVFAMTYDFYGAWDGTLGHQAGLYAATNEATPGFNGDTAIDNLLAAGVPADKLVLGVAMYGRGWQGVTGGSANDPFSGTGGSAIPGTWEAGVLDYKDIEQNYLGGANGTGINGFTYGYDAQAEAPWLYSASKGQLISFENERSAKAKAKYAKDHGLAGVFSWEIDADNGRILDAMRQGVAR